MKITHKQGNTLLAALGAGMAFPEKLGKDEFDVASRACAMDEMRAARRALLSYSELWAAKRKVLFGHAINWRQADEKGDRWTLIDEQIEVDVKLDEEAERGLFWVLLLMLHPGSPFLLGVDIQEDVSWPVAELLGYRNDLREMTGLSQRKSARQLRKDSDPSWKQKSNLRKVELDEQPAEKKAEAAG